MTIVEQRAMTHGKDMQAALAELFVRKAIGNVFTFTKSDFANVHRGYISFPTFGMRLFREARR